MKLTLKNIGKIEDAIIELNGITVIAGENNTGKSTVGKALYSLFTAFYNIEKRIVEERIDIIQNVLELRVREKFHFRFKRNSNFEELSRKICRDKEEYLNNRESLKKEIIRIYKEYNEIQDLLHNEDMNFTTDKILSYLRISDSEIKEDVLKKVLLSEYNMQVANINCKEKTGKIVLEIQGHKIDVDIVENRTVKINDVMEINSILLYLDDPFVLDELNSFPPMFLSKSATHREKTKEFIRRQRTNSIIQNTIEELSVKNKLEKVILKLTEICDGGIIETEGDYKYKSEKYSEPLMFSNISTGFKTFLILKTLLMNGTIIENGTIVLDEPEIHLHPQWQLNFAELIVLIQKEFGMHILLNTHSPYFLRAIEVYAAKYEIADKCKYYLSERDDEKSLLEDVTLNTDKIYEKLAKPLEILEIEKFNND